MHKIAMCSYVAYFLSSATLFSQDSIVRNHELFSFEVSYLGDNINNLKGGLKTGSLYIGMANIKVGIHTENARLWKGGLLCINVANTHGRQPSGELTGDFQVVSNIEAGNHTYIQELWYKQSFGPVELTGGLQDLNVEFANTENGGLYLNSSFGIIPTITGNIPAPVFPLTSPGISVKWNINEKTTWLGAIYDGCPTNFEDNPYNVHWELNADDGALLVSEMQYSINMNNMSGTSKVGFYAHHHYSKQKDETADPERAYATNIGIYAIADQTVWQEPSNNKSLGLFIQFGWSPEKFNQAYYYTGIGLDYSGWLNSQGLDVLGLAMAHARLIGTEGNETTIEFTYRVPLTRNIFVQPDFQYIINPAGTGEKLQNCFAATIRFGIDFE
jgi:porin